MKHIYLLFVLITALVSTQARATLEIIITEGGFKSIFEDPFANEWIATTNASISVWRFVEIYGDAGFLKNRNEAARFKYDSGIRLNFIHNFLEVYFPLQSKKI